MLIKNIALAHMSIQKPTVCVRPSMPARMFDKRNDSLNAWLAPAASMPADHVSSKPTTLTTISIQKPMACGCRLDARTLVLFQNN